MEYRAPKGTADMLPGTARAWEHMQRTAQDLFARYGYEPVYTPTFEQTEVFVRSIGEATDIVAKEMYTFEDRGGRSITLRPEGTASVVRSAVEHGLVTQGRYAKLYYSGPMFRYERPQAGRMRQFWQIGAEFLGPTEPSADAELIVLLVRFFESLGITGTTLLINSMGDDACRPAYREKLAAYIRAHDAELCEECRRRADTNPLRAFDCKNPACQSVMQQAPKLDEELCDGCAEHHAAVKRHLDGRGVAYVEDPSLVLGLDYYTRTVFEITSSALGAQSAVCGGGRYDGLVASLGGPPTPAVGFGLGLERFLMVVKATASEAAPPRRGYQGIALGADARVRLIPLLAAIRNAGALPAFMDFGERKLAAQFKIADRNNARFALILGDDELAAGEIVVRDLVARDERRLPFADVEATARVLVELAA